MTNYIYAFHGGNKPATPEEGAAVMAKWGAWMEGLGSAIVNPGAPVGQSITVSAPGVVVENGGANPLSGFTIIQANSMEEAVKLADNCPIFDGSGSIEIAEFIDM